MKTVYFVRHGRTEASEEEIYQTFDQPLTDRGREQAKKAASFFKGMKIELMISSTMDRALETAQIVSVESGLNLNIQKVPDLQEANRPTVVRGKSVADTEVIKIMDEVRKNFDNPNWKHSDEENFFDLKKRAGRVLKLIEGLGADIIIAVTHATFLKILLAVSIFGDDLTLEICKKFTRHFKVDNTSISKLVHKDGVWSVKSWNDHGHLLDEIEQ